MKIAVVARWTSRTFTGVFEVSRRFSQSICELGQDDVRIFGMEDEFAKADSPLWQPLQASTFPAKWGTFGYAPELTAALLAYKPDVVHVHGIWTYTGIAALRCAKTHGTPYMLSPHGMLDPWAVANSGWKKRMARMFYEEAVQSRTACMHAATPVELADFRKYGRKNPVCVVPYGVDIPGANLRGPAPWQNVVPEGAKTILFMGRYHPKKGVMPLLQAWKQCNGEDPRFKNDWHLILVGYDEGGHEGELRSYVESENLGRHVHFLPPQFGDSRSGAYFNCDAFILPSFSEGLPTAVLLAWAHEKPVIITKHCNLNPAIDAGAGLIIDPEAKSIAKGLLEFARMPTNDREAMGRIGLQLVQKTYVWSEVSKQLREVYAWMQGGGEKPACVRV